MQNLSKRQKNNLIIGGLCCILLLMGIGYAAFNAQLKINGTSNISSNWRVLITDITSGDVVGDASNEVEPTHTETTATFSTNLVSPGDSITYTITVANQGSIDAVLRSIDVNTGSNEAIKFVTSGIEEGDILLKETTDELKIKVSYDSSVTSQPSTMASTITVTLTYEQKGSGTIIPGGDTVNMGGQDVELVTSGDGLYEDTYEDGRYIYRGENPNNYIEFNDELWRIIAKETDGTYKIIRNDVLANRAFDEANHRSTANNSYCTVPSLGCGVYAAVEGTFSSPSGSQSGTVTEDSSIKIYLNDDYYVNNINAIAKGQMTSHTFNIGAVERLDQSGAEADSIGKNIEGEKKYTWTGNVGLANVSDILKASTNPLCTSATTSNNGTNECNSNYLLDKGAASSLSYWTINADSSEYGGGSYRVWRGAVGSSVAAVGSAAADFGPSPAPRPVVFLKSSTTLNGSGTSDDPFTIV